MSSIPEFPVENAPKGWMGSWGDETKDECAAARKRGQMRRHRLRDLLAAIEHSGNHLEARNEATKARVHAAKSSAAIDEVQLAHRTRNPLPCRSPVLFASKCEQEVLLRRGCSALTLAPYQEIKQNIHSR